MSRDAIAGGVRNFILEENNLAAPSIIEHDTNLIDAGLLDSLMIVSLVSFCEDEYNCDLTMDELTMENFTSVGAITDLIGAKVVFGGLKADWGALKGITFLTRFNSRKVLPNRSLHRL